MHRPFSSAPHLSRRNFFEVLGSGVTGSYLAGLPLRAADTRPAVTPQNKAKNVIFILMTGAPSHVDTFDLKMTNGVTPSNFNPATVNGIFWPTGLLPKIGGQLGNVAVVRSMRSWALVHSLAQTWTQIGRSPAAALGDVAPHIGSVVALEKEKERTPSQVFPTFLALNAGNAAGSGYFSATYAPFKLNPAPTGIPNTANTDGQTRHESRLKFLRSFDGSLRAENKSYSDYDAFYNAANGMMFNAAVTSAFTYSTAESTRYGNNAFGNACLVAKQVLAANQGTRFIQVNIGNWDHHNDIYGTDTPTGNNLYTLGKVFDDGVGTLLADLAANGSLKETLVVIAGEFGRTTGRLSNSGGRDHHLQQFAAFAGGGVKGGRALGATDATGGDVANGNYGWKANRYVRPEDVEATVYSALGIDWTKQLDTPFGRTFEYVPDAADGLYMPIDELWG